MNVSVFTKLIKNTNSDFFVLFCVFFFFFNEIIFTSIKILLGKNIKMND